MQQLYVLPEAFLYRLYLLLGVLSSSVRIVPRSTESALVSVNEDFPDSSTTPHLLAGASLPRKSSYILYITPFHLHFPSWLARKLYVDNTGGGICIPAARPRWFVIEEELRDDGTFHPHCVGDNTPVLYAEYRSKQQPPRAYGTVKAATILKRVLHFCIQTIPCISHAFLSLLSTEEEL